MKTIELPNRHILFTKKFNVYPDRIIPSQKEIDEMKRGDYVKVGIDFDRELIGAEFFWVRVQSNEKGVITGTVDNDLVNVKTIKCDDLISFPSHWVIDTLKEKKLQLGNFGA